MFDWYDANNIDASRYYPIIPIDEIWIPVSNKVYDDLMPYYFVSDFGRILSTYGHSHYLTASIDKYGYCQSTLCLYENPNRKINRISIKVHRTVLISFCDYKDNGGILPDFINDIIPPLPDNYKELEVNHKDSTPIHNWLWNLEWSTSKENTRHAIKYGSINNTLQEEQVLEIIQILQSGNYNSYAEIARSYGIHPSAISNICRGKFWTDINPYSTNPQLATNPLTIEELHAICKFFESNDINNKLLYPSINSVCKACFDYLEFGNKYTFSAKRRSLSSILLKKTYDEITKKYNYNYIL